MAAFDRERAARQHALRAVFAADVSARRGRVRVDGAFPVDAELSLVARHLRLRDRAGAERVALGGPALVRGALEVVKDDVGPRCGRGTRGAGTDRALDHRESVAADNRVDAFLGTVGRRVAGDRVLHPARHRRLDRLRAGIAECEAHEGRGQGRVILVERDEGGEGLEGYADRAAVVAVVDAADRILAGEVDFLPPGVVERAHVVAAGAGDAQRETLRKGGVGFQRFRVARAARTAVVDAVEDVPVPEAPVAAEVELAAADAAHRHADEARFGPSDGRRGAPREERLHPGGIEFLLRRDEPVELGPCERPGHDRDAGDCGAGDGETGGLEKLPPPQPRKGIVVTAACDPALESVHGRPPL